MVDDDTRRSPIGRRKNALFCRRCGHESPTDGDWRVRATPSGALYRCPACGADVARRPVGEALHPGGSAAERPPWSVACWVRLARAWAAWPRAFVPTPGGPSR